jgi:hypothetical protein
MDVLAEFSLFEGRLALIRTPHLAQICRYDARD